MHLGEASLHKLFSRRCGLLGVGRTRPLEQHERIDRFQFIRRTSTSNTFDGRSLMDGWRLRSLPGRLPRLAVNVCWARGVFGLVRRARSHSRPPASCALRPTTCLRKQWLAPQGPSAPARGRRLALGPGSPSSDRTLAASIIVMVWRIQIGMGRPQHLFAIADHLGAVHDIGIQRPAKNPHGDLDGLASPRWPQVAAPFGKLLGQEAPTSASLPSLAARATGRSVRLASAGPSGQYAAAATQRFDQKRNARRAFG